MERDEEHTDTLASANNLADARLPARQVTRAAAISAGAMEDTEIIEWTADGQGKITSVCSYSPENGRKITVETVAVFPSWMTLDEMGAYVDELETLMRVHSKIARVEEMWRIWVMLPIAAVALSAGGVNYQTLPPGRSSMLYF